MHQTDWKSFSGLGILLVAIGAAFWGTDGVLRQPLVEQMPSNSIVLAEHLILLLFAVPVLYSARQIFGKLNVRGWLALLVISWGGSGLATVLFTEAFAHGNPTTVILLQKTQPLIVVLLAGVLLKEGLPKLYWPLLGVALVGSYLLAFGTLDPFWTLGTEQIAAAGLAVGAAALWGGSTVMGRFLLADIEFSTVAAARFFFAVPFLFGLALARGNVGATFTGMANDPVRLVILALIVGLLGMLVYYQGLTRTPASYATIAELSFPATAVIVNWIFLDETISANQAFGFVILWVAIAALTWLPAYTQAPERRATEPSPGA